MQTQERIEPSIMSQNQSDARDEMNLAEFPLCALSHRLPPEVKTLRFEDRVWDKGRNDWTVRRVTVSGSDAFGLPTALDDEVLLGLIHLTRLREFADRKVPFTRHQLIRLLNWRDDTKNYHRLEMSLNRWTGVTVYYDKAWWSRNRQCWVDAKFHVLDNVWLCHRSEPPPETGLPEAGVPTSAFVWNEVIFQSFRSGNLKSIDLNFYTSLKSSVAKRLYRFLDKRFHFGKRYELDLHNLCFEHIGISRKSDTANLKRKLFGGIRELEQRGYLEPLTMAQQFQKVRSREWRVVFRRAMAKASRDKQPKKIKTPPLLEALTDRGIHLSAAQDLIMGYDAEDIQKQLEVFDWLIGRNDARVSRNPAGFLISSIQEEYCPPKEFLNRIQKAAAKTQTDKISVQKKNLAQLKMDADHEAVSEFWGSLSEAERIRLEAEALAQASRFHKDLMEGDGVLAEASKKSLLNAYALKTLQSDPNKKLSD